MCMQERRPTSPRKPCSVSVNCMPSRQRSGAVQQNNVWRQEKPELRQWLGGNRKQHRYGESPQFRKNWLFAGSDSGGEYAVVLYSLIGTCRLNNVEPEKWLRYVIEHIQDWPANRVRDLLPWKVELTAQ